MRRPVGVLFVATVLLVVAAAAPLSGVAAADTSNSSQWSYDELSERGIQIEGQDPSSRYLGSRGIAFVWYDETNVVKELSKLNQPEWAVDKVITPGQVVDTQTVNLDVSRTRGAPSETVHVHVVMWQKTTETIEQGNTTTTEPAATNVTHQVHEVQLNGGGSTAEIDLPHTEEQRRVTMWVEEYPSSRWVFPYEPVATSEALPFGNNWASFLAWFFPRFLGLLAIGVPVAIGGAFKAVDAVGSSPGKGIAWWVVVPGFLLYMAGYLALGRIAELIVTAPWVLALAIVALAFVATAERAKKTKTALVEQVVTKNSTNALGEDVPDVETERGTMLDVVDLGGERLALVKPGNLKKWLLVALTDAEWPVLDLSDMDSRVSYESDTSVGGKVADMKIYVAEGEGDLLGVQWPGVELSMANLKVRRDELPAGDGAATDGGTVEPPEEIGDGWSQERVVGAVTAWSVGAIAASAVVGVGVQAAAIGLLPAAVKTARVRHSWARIVWAPKHDTKAKASRVAEHHEHEIAETFDDIQTSESERDGELAERVMNLVETRTSKDREILWRLLGFEGEDAPDRAPPGTGTGTAGPSSGSPGTAATDGGTEE